MESIILKTFRNINSFNPRRFFELPCIQNKFMSAPSVRVRVQNRIMRFQPRQDVIGVEKSNLGRMGQPLPTHHLDICMTDRKNTCASPRSSIDWIDCLITSTRYQRVAWKIWDQMTLHGNRSN